MGSLVTSLISVFTGAATAVTAISNVRSAEKQAKAVQKTAESQSEGIKEEGDVAVQQRAKQVRLRAARQTSSFITSGLTLEGTPGDVLNETFDVGIEDVENIGRNAQRARLNTLRGAGVQSSDIISTGRRNSLNTLASGFSNFAGGDGAGSLFGSSPTQNNRGIGGVPLPVRKPVRGFG